MRTALAAFRSSLTRIRNIATHVDSEVLLATSPDVRERHETMLCGAVVVSAGHFEFFLRDAVRAFIGAVSAMHRPFGALPPAFQKAHYIDGAALLYKRTTNKAPWIVDSHEQIVERMHSVQVSMPYTLFWEAFASTNSNPGPRTVYDVLRRCDISKPWDVVSAKSVRKRGGNTLQAALDSLIKLRHECAHTGRASRYPTTTELRDHVTLLDDIGEGITGALEERLAML